MTRTVGRPPAAEVAEIRRSITFKPSEWAEISRFLGPDTRVATWMRDLILNTIHGLLPSTPEEYQTEIGKQDHFTAPLLPRVPCGPWSQAMETTAEFSISNATADELGARPGDVFFQARGDSMRGAGILENYIVLSRPMGSRAPSRGDVVMVECIGPNLEPVYTLKRWISDGSPGVPPRLEDGDGNPYELPDGAEARAVARALGVVGRLT